MPKSFSTELIERYHHHERAMGDTYTYTGTSCPLGARWAARRHRHTRQAARSCDACKYYWGYNKGKYNGVIKFVKIKVCKIKCQNYQQR